MAKQKNIRRKRKARKPLDGDSMPPLPKHAQDFLYDVHCRVFKAIGIASCVRFASDSRIVGQPDLSGGLKVAEQIMGEVTEAIEDALGLAYFHAKNADEEDES